MLRCYACGQEVDRDDFYLVSEAEETDRVFVFCSGCEHVPEDPAIMIAVSQLELA